MKQNLGMVTAYAYAVVGGYEGTEAEFEALLGNIATDLAEIENLTVVATTLPAGSQATASYSDGVLTLGIPKGDTGATGQGATVAVGSTSTGNPGTNASVTNSGTSKDAVFNFTIPRGNTGNGIDSIYLTGTSGAVKTYTILYTDGNTTTFDVTDGEVTNATLTAVLADYAKIDGYYESLGSGTADQLASNIYEEDSVPYNFRTSGGSIDIGDRETDMIVGGTVAWNQLLTNTQTTSTINGITFTNNGNGTYTVNGTATADATFALSGGSGKPAHKVLLCGCPAGGSPSSYMLWDGYAGWFDSGNGTVKPFANSGNWGILITVKSGITVDNIVFKPQLFDLTQMFGSTIADYIYSLEQATAGAGVAWFRKLFPKPYYAYNAGELMSVNASSHDMVGFNQWDEEWRVGAFNSRGEFVTGYNFVCSANPIKVFPNTRYYINDSVLFWEYDANMNCLRDARAVNNALVLLNPNAHYIHFRTNYEATTYNGDICINLSWDGERDGEYEAYVKHSYPLDSSLILRGIPKLDASNNLYYDGDVYESDGTVTRKYGTTVLNGTQACGVLNSANGNLVQVVVSGLANAGDNDICVVSDKFPATTSNIIWSGSDSGIALHGHITETNRRVWIRGTGATTDAEAQTYLTNNPITIVYELATPTTETADPYTNPQIVNDFGTEEYIDYAVSQGDRDVSIPVGHYTQYMANLKAKLEMSPNSPEGAGDYIVRQTNGENEYVSLASNATIQDIIARLEALEGGGE